MSESRRSKRTSSPDLFEAGQRDRMDRDQPLAARLRPRSLDEFVGQDHILGPGRLLRRAIQADQLSSLIFYGPPGTGKTTLALVIANTTRSHFITINAVLAGVADIRQAVEEAQERKQLYSHRTILFVDEVHRFNKSQQDALLPWVENGTVILIGATTENPYFSVNRPLVSRSRIFQLRSLTEADLRRIAKQALEDGRGYADRPVRLDEEALDHLVNVANGDARAVLNAIELAVATTPPGDDGHLHITLAVAEESIQQRAVLYDKGGDYHFDTISAFIKSMRGSDPDATMYWLARMVYAGEDPNFIFRRMLIFAGEDVGLADAGALQVVVAAAEAFDRVGLPEGRFHLAQAALYLSTAAKSNSTFAFFDALAAVEKEHEGEVPNHLRDASRDSEGFGHGANYLYPHAYQDHWVPQQYLPDSLHGRVFYQPSDQGRERDIGEKVTRRRELQLAAVVDDDDSLPEILTHSPADPARDQWLLRATGEVSGQLHQIRTRIFGPLNLERHHVVLDLAAASGLLSWEALRRVPEGSVWALHTSSTGAVAMREMGSRLAEIERPIVLEGPLERAADLVGWHDGDIRFDAIIGRNCLADLPDKGPVLGALRRLAAAGARLSLAQIVPGRAQRLRDLVSLGQLDGDLADRVVAAEEAIYSDADNPRVNWSAQDLQRLCQEAGFESVTCQVETFTATRRITLQQLGHWFGPGGDKRPTFARYLRRHLAEEEVREVRKLFENELANRNATWTMVYAFLTAMVPPE